MGKTQKEQIRELKKQILELREEKRELLSKDTSELIKLRRENAALKKGLNVARLKVEHYELENRSLTAKIVKLEEKENDQEQNE